VQEKTIATLKELKSTTMAKLFREGLRGERLKQTEIGEMPESWDVVRLGDVSSGITKGSSPNWQGYSYCSTGVLFLRSQNVGHGELLLSGVACVPEEFSRKERRSILRAGDILVNIVGASIGRVAVADARLDGANMNQAVALVRLPLRSHNPLFFMYSLLSWAGLDQMHRQKKEIARANLSLEDVSSFVVPAPERNEQDEIVGVLENIRARTSMAEHKRDTLKSFFSSMLHLLMTGRVRVSDFRLKEQTNG
jgi:type I restriction enzyme S subunit